MKLHRITLSVLCVLVNVVLLAAAEPNLADLTRELTGEKPAATRTPEQLDAVYGQVIDSLVPNLGNESVPGREGSYATLERIAFRAGQPSMEADRLACSKVLAAKLGPDVAPLARMWILRQLERMARAEAVSQIAAVLADKDPLVRESARRAIQKNPAPEANTALQRALAAADTPAWRVALINALAQRCDAANLGALKKEAAAANDDVRTAAVVGLSRLGDPSAAAIVAAAMNQGSPLARRIATDSYVRLADALVRNGNKAAAREIYQKLLGMDGHWKCAGIIGIGRVGGAEDLPTLFAAAADQDANIRGACVEALCLLEGQQVTAAIDAQVKSSKPEVRLALLQALTRRGAKGSLPTFLAAVEDPDEAVQAAALAGLGTIGNLTAVPVLLKAAAGSGVTQEAARQSLQMLCGAEVDQAMVAAMGQQEPKLRVEAIRALAARHVVAATPTLIRAADDAESSVRSESLKALGLVAPSEALAPLAALLVKTEDNGTRTDAGDALVKIANRDQDFDNRCDPILAALAKSSGPARLALLGVLGRIGGQKSLDAVRAATKDADEKVRDAAVRSMVEWPDALAAADLLEIAKTAPRETHQVLAIRGYIRVCRIRTNRPGVETAKLLAAGLEAARRPDEKRQALGGLADCHELEAFRAVVPCMNDKDLKEEAAIATVHIARDVWNRDPQAVVDALHKAMEISRNENLKHDAQECLERAQQKLKETKAKK